ncbi:hypothetical protein HMPREF1979_01886 [Actinomyces johnsonii F0542]|uniref:Uncharacterized protein n=1 Tax=Actinomyces johnsonii F0542 TaxID=1321818 RepID=U1QNG9_9ACTO|nr:hypothetical protein HMPREF1979_01886 [Actinomyces johnsonii F0542]
MHKRYLSNILCGDVSGNGHVVGRLLATAARGHSMWAEVFDAVGDVFSPTGAVRAYGNRFSEPLRAECPRR